MNANYNSNSVKHCRWLTKHHGYFLRSGARFKREVLHLHCYTSGYNQNSNNKALMHGLLSSTTAINFWQHF